MVLKNFSTSSAMAVAKVVKVLEQYKGTDDITSNYNSQVVQSKCRDLDRYSSSSRRDALKFFRKRISCKCLKKMHLEARKSTPKMGICCGCLKETVRASLSVCSKCMVNQYCSRECQVSNWDKHRDDCALLCSDQAAY